MLIFICASELTMENTSVTSVMHSAGITSSLAYTKICVIYTREKIEVNPVERKVCTSVWQSEPIYCALEVISPEL